MFEIPLPLLILQHPQEPSRRDSEVSSAQLLKETVSPVHISTGLSWKSLEHASQNFTAIQNVDELKKPALWHTLYLGTKSQGSVEQATEPGIYYLDKKGNPTHPELRPEIGGLILIDGTWAQAKTLWWRNAWLLKTKRIYIVPKSKSLYGNIRREPRPECVSTLEAAAETLSFLGLDEKIETALKAVFQLKLRQRSKG